MRFVEHLEIGMEGCEVPGHIRAQIFREPLGRPMQLCVAIVLARNQKRRDLKPDIRLVPEIFERIEHWLKLRKAKPMIKRISERFQIDIRRVHVLIKFCTRIISDVTGRNRHGFDPALAARVRNIDRVLGKDHRIVVSKRDGSTAEPFRCERDLLRRRGIGEFVPLTRLGNVPVLTKPATEIATGRTKREHTRSRQKMVQRFFLDRINTESAASAISSEQYSIT